MLYYLDTQAIFIEFMQMIFVFFVLTLMNFDWFLWLILTGVIMLLSLEMNSVILNEVLTNKLPKIKKEKCKSIVDISLNRN